MKCVECTEIELCQEHEQVWQNATYQDDSAGECDECGGTDDHTEDCAAPDALSEQEARLDREFDEKVALAYI